MTAVLLALIGGCSKTTAPQTRLMAALPAALDTIHIAYVSSGLQPDYSRTPSGFSIYGEMTAALQMQRANAAATKLNGKGVHSVDAKIMQLAPEIFQRNGLQGTVTTYVTQHRMFDEMKSKAEDAKARDPQRPIYWLLIWPGSGETSTFGSSLTFEASLWNLSDQRSYWRSNYTMALGRSDIDDEKVEQMLSAVIGAVATARP